MEVECEYCKKIIIEDDEDRYKVLRAIGEHILKECTNNICYTSHGTFTMVDGTLFESVIF